MLSTLIPLLAISTPLIHAAALLPRGEFDIPAQSHSKHIKYVTITEYSTVYPQTNPTAAPPPPNTPGAPNTTKTPVVPVTTSLRGTGNKSACNRKSSSLLGTAPASYPTYGPDVPAPAPSGKLDPSNLPKFSYAPLPGSSNHAVPSAHNPLKSATAPGVAAPSSGTPLLPVKTTAIVVVPLHPPSTAIVVVPTHPPAKVQAEAMDVNLRTVAGQNGEMGPLNRYWRFPGAHHAIETTVPEGVARMIPRAAPDAHTDSSVEHGYWENHKHFSHHIEDGEFAVGGEKDAGRQGSSVRPTVPTSASTSTSDMEITSQIHRTVTKTLKRSSSKPSNSTATPTFKRPHPEPKLTAHPTPSPTKDIHIHTSVMTPDSRCPYPYPGIYCGKPKTTLITVTNAPPATPSPSSSSKKEEKKDKKAKTSKSWCPYPGQDC